MTDPAHFCPLWLYDNWSTLREIRCTSLHVTTCNDLYYFATLPNISYCALGSTHGSVVSSKSMRIHKYSLNVSIRDRIWFVYTRPFISEKLDKNIRLLHCHQNYISIENFKVLLFNNRIERFKTNKKDVKMIGNLVDSISINIKNAMTMQNFRRFILSPLSFVVNS